MPKISLKNSIINKIFSEEEMSVVHIKIEVYVHRSRFEHTVYIERTELQQEGGVRGIELMEVMFRANQGEEVSVTTVYERRPGRTPEL